MVTHKIEFDEVNDQLIKHQIAGAFGGGQNKRLNIIWCKGSTDFEVKYHKEVVYMGDSLEKAVEIYNDLI
jgi:hypothetical protein